MSSQPADADAAFVLHTYPYRETSLILETFTRTHGRVALIARGARRPRSALRGMVQSFQPLLLSWFGKGELKTLKTAEAERIYPQLQGAALLSAFYLNELILKLSRREDPHERLHAAYDSALTRLVESCAPRNVDEERRAPGRAIAAALRQFEKQLLVELGYGLVFDRDAEGTPIEASGDYYFVPDRGAIRLANGRRSQVTAVELIGKTLLDMARDDYQDPVTAQQAKQLMRQVINHHLNGVELNTRQLLRELQQS